MQGEPHPLEPAPLAPYRRPSAEAIEAFWNEVKRLGLPAYLRTARGDDIDAACGHVAARNEPPPPALVPLRMSPA